MKPAAIFFLVFLVFSQSQAQGSFDLQASGGDSVFIRGHILLQKRTSPAIKFSAVDNVLGIERHEYAQVEPNGKFQIRFFLRNPQNVWWRYGDRVPGLLLLSPGDTLTLIISDNKVTYGGESARACEDYDGFRTIEEAKAYFNALEKGYSLEPEEYLAFRKRQHEKDIERLTSYCLTRGCSEFFREWYYIDAEVRYFTDLMNYSWKSLRYGLGSERRLSPAQKSAYDSAYWGTLNVDNPSYMMSSHYRAVLNSYYNRYSNASHLEEIQKAYQLERLNRMLDFLNRQVSQEVDHVSAEKKVLEQLRVKVARGHVPDSSEQRVVWKISERFYDQLQRAMSEWSTDRQMERLNAIYPEKARELILLHRFMGEIHTRPNSEYVYQWTYNSIKNPEYKILLKDEYRKWMGHDQDPVAASNTPVRIKPRNYQKTANELLSDIVKANKGKLIILDLWATWCGPCLEDFAIMNTIKEKLPGDRIAYTYLCAQSNPDLWRKQIQKYDVSGDHYFLSETQYADLMKRLGLKFQFPSYVIIDTRGKPHAVQSIRDQQQFIDKVSRLMGEN